jgi:ABC-2 type transport system ATP-binding protein
VRRLNREEGMTIILTTHYLQEAEEMCDEIAIINEGELVARNTTSALLGELDARTMVIEPEATPETLPDLEGVEVEERGGGILALTYHAREMRAEDVLDAVRAAGIRISDVRTEQPDLEDVFLALTKGAHG